MTANELADLIERCNDCGYNQDAANMLRQMGLAESIIKQQQIEIETLKTVIQSYKIRPRGKSEFAMGILRKAQEK